MIMGQIQDFSMSIAVADPGSPTGEGGANLLVEKSFAENCMKIKEIGPRGGASLVSLSLRSANVLSNKMRQV